MVSRPQRVCISLPMMTFVFSRLMLTAMLVIPGIVISFSKSLPCLGKMSVSPDLLLCNSAVRPLSLLCCRTGEAGDSLLITRHTMISPLVKPFLINTWRTSPFPVSSSYALTLFSRIYSRIRSRISLFSTAPRAQSVFAIMEWVRPA